MTRAEKMTVVRAKILDTAKKLFMEQGYKKTTIRQIVEKSGITSGSIYNLFENKDDVFAALVDEMMDESIEMVEKEFADNGPVYQYAGILMVEWIAIEKYPVIREIFYEAHTTPLLFEKVVERAMRLEDHLFGRSPLSVYKRDSFRMRLLLYKGAMTAYIESFSFRRLPDPDRIRRQLAAIAFLSMGMKKRDLKILMAFMEDNLPTWERIADQLALA